MPLQKIELATEVANRATARSFVREVLSEAAEGLRGCASLLVSEVVRNALLHASGPVTVEVVQKGTPTGFVWATEARRPRPTRAIGQTTPPAVVCPSWTAWRPPWAGSGLAREVVWFDVPEPLEDSATRGPGRRSYEDPYPGGVPISLIGAPIKMMIRPAAHYDAL